MFDLGEFVKESNDIEGIYGFTDKDLEAHERFLNLEEITIADLEIFVAAVQPGAVIRDQPGMNVRVGIHTPMPGGQKVRGGLAALLRDVNRFTEPQHAYCAYEFLHPFMDGNGRSGRALWLWLMGQRRQIRDDTSFLKQFHYQTLEVFESMVRSLKDG